MDLEKKSLHYLNLLNPFATIRTKEILQVNPTIIPQRLESNNVTIDVYDVRGRKIRELLSASEAKGYHSNSFNLNYISRGFYFMKITYRDQVIYRRFSKI